MATRSSKTPQLDALIAQEPDLVDRIFEYLLAEIPGFQAHVTAERLQDAKLSVREHFGGREAYVRSPLSDQRREQAEDVLRLFDGKNATEVARRLHIGRATVYRVLKQAGGKKKSQRSG